MGRKQRLGHFRPLVGPQRPSWQRTITDDFSCSPSLILPGELYLKSDSTEEDRMHTQEFDYIRGGKKKDKYTASEVAYWPCPLCGSEKETLIKTERDVLRIVSCVGCGLVRTNPRLEHPDEVYTGKIDI